ncbi:MAG: SAF domain-containing protein, partial [Gaiellaceae bacterium]
MQVRLRSPDEARPAGPSVRRRLVRPLPLLGLLLVVIALAGYWSVYSATTERTPVLVAAHDLTAGTVVRPSDLRTAELAGDAGTMAALVPERELETVLGRELATPVAQGAPLARDAVAPAGAGSAAFTLVVPAMRALGGSLRPGDRVTVLATFDGGPAGAQARAIARGLRVL